MNPRIRRIVVVAMLAVFLSATAFTSSADDPVVLEDPAFLLRSWTLGSAGVGGTGEGLVLRGTLGQVGPVGLAGDDHHGISAGFWTGRVVPPSGTGPVIAAGCRHVAKAYGNIPTSGELGISAIRIRYEITSPMP